MKLIIYVNNNDDGYEDEKALFDLDNNKLIFKVNYNYGKIKGYLQALEDFNIYKDKVEIEWIDESHKHFHLIGFTE